MRGHLEQVKCLPVGRNKGAAENQVVYLVRKTAVDWVRSCYKCQVNKLAPSGRAVWLYPWSRSHSRRARMRSKEGVRMSGTGCDACPAARQENPGESQWHDLESHVLLIIRYSRSQIEVSLQTCILSTKWLSYTRD